MSRQVKKIRALQRKYSPGALQHLATAGDAVDAVEPERIPLLLPSALSTAEHLPPLSVEGLAAAEARLKRGCAMSSAGRAWTRCGTTLL